MRLPAFSPGMVLPPPPPKGVTSRVCDDCECSWYGYHDDGCWLCGKPGKPGPLRLVTPKRL